MHVEIVRTPELFTTPEFKDSPWIAKICAEVPTLWICHDEEVPGHFGTYFGCTYSRRDTYKNPYIRDLYFLHELSHMALFAYAPALGYNEWVKKTRANEFRSSLRSECEPYLRILGLRAKTFSHPIWVDRFDAVHRVQNLGHVLVRTEYHEVMRMIDQRRRALYAPSAEADFLEEQIYNYGRQTVEWCRIWSEPVGVGTYADEPAFRVVERHMADPNRDETHAEWLEEVCGNGNNVPFRAQALAFAPIFNATGSRFGNHRLSL